MSKPFHFKQFTIHQNKAAMKVGTDGVLLGAWASVDTSVESILDIGSGTGLIALMMAQRSSADEIDAIELNGNAYEQTVENFENSNWNNRLFCYHTSIQDYANEIDDSYDLIVSNPPFYNSTYKKLDENRAMARHSESLTNGELLESTSKLLSKIGSCAFIIPYSESEKFIEIATKNMLLLNRITFVKGTPNTSFKRSLMQFSFQKKAIVKTELTIENNRHNYTKEYIDLVKEFYLKM